MTLQHPTPSFAVRRLLCAIVLCLLVSVPADAAQITLAWDANPEPDIAGYIVEYGPSTSPFTLAVDVGNKTTWTLTAAAPGISYIFRVIAYNALGERSDTSASVTGMGTTPGGPTLTADRAALAFGLTTSSLGTASQTVRLTQTGSGSASWTASADVSWLKISPAFGYGSGSFTVSLVPGAAPSTAASALITIVTDGTSNLIAPIPVTLSRVSSASSAAPIGAIDTPVNNATGLTGAVAITGWALDDIDIARIRIYRDPVAGEPPGLAYIGDAIRIEDARPDVAAAFPNHPANYRGGWGYLALTNMFANRGDGTFRLSVFADDVEGRTTLLGVRTITCANATATQPFGTIDRPAPGETVSGTSYTGFGWVLSPGVARADVPGGGKVSVLIDGAVVTTPVGWNTRPDLAALFPAAQYQGIGTAMAAFAFDTTKLSNGVHTIAWIVTDSMGATQGVGSRFFRVFNGSAPVVAAMQSEVRSVSPADEIAGARAVASSVEARRGYALDVPFRTYAPDEQGRIVIQSEELDRIEINTGGATAGYLRVGNDLRPLPAGSTLSEGMFVWGTAAGFVGQYDLVFTHRNDTELLRQEIRIVLNPKGSNRVGPQVVIDITTPFLGGWAADLDSGWGTGIDTIHVWAYPRDPSGQAAPVFLGQAAYGGERPDVAAVYGDRFLRAGFGLLIPDLPPGTYDLAVFAWSSVRRDWLPAAVVPYKR